MNRYGKCTGKPVQAVTDIVPPSDPAPKRRRRSAQARTWTGRPRSVRI